MMETMPDTYLDGRSPAYDAVAKKLIATRSILSWILKYCVKEWGEWIPTPSDMYRKLYPRIAALAECGWTSPSNKSWKRFNQAAYKENLRWKQLYQ